MAAWAAISGSLPHRDLLHQRGTSDFPAGYWSEGIDSYDLPGNTRIYTHVREDDDMGGFTTLFALACNPTEETDARLLEEAFFRTGFCYGLAMADELSTVLPSEWLQGLIVDAIDKPGVAILDGSHSNLADAAPDHLPRWSPEWKFWVAGKLLDVL